MTQRFGGDRAHWIPGQVEWQRVLMEQSEAFLAGEEGDRFVLLWGDGC